MRQISRLYTPNQQCYGVQYSPNNNTIIACVTCDKFGLAGAASLCFIKHSENSLIESKFSIIDSYKFGSSLFDLDWSHSDPHLLVTANGDGSIAIWKWPIDQHFLAKKPLFLSKKHSREVYVAKWEPSGMRAFNIFSASWDETIIIWNLNNSGLTSLTNLRGHNSMINTGAWNPKTTGLLLSASADRKFRVWDVSNCTSNSVPIFGSKPLDADILAVDWNDFDSNMFALGYASGLIEMRDFRKMQEPLHQIKMAHKYPVKKLKFSPHIPGLFASVSYDMNTKVWSAEGNLISESVNHEGFVYGLDFDPLFPNRLVDCGWDRKVVISEFQIPGMVPKNVLI